MIYRTIFIVIICSFWISCKQSSEAPKPVPTGNSMIDQISLQINEDAGNPTLLYKRAEAYYELDQYDLAIEDLQNAIQLDSLKPSYYHLLADNYLNYYRSKEAIQTMEKAVDLFPERIPTLLKMSEMYLYLKQYDNSMLAVNEILRLSPQNSEAYFMLGMNFRSMGDTEKAINAFLTAVENDPELLDAWIILGDLHEQINSKKAIAFYDNAIAIAPDNPQAIHAKAFYLQNHGDVPKAIELYKEIILKDSEYIDAYLNSGILYIEMDSLDLAFEQFNLMAARQPQNPLAYYYRGLIHQSYGNLEAAKIDFQNVLNFDSDNEAAMKLLSEIEQKLSQN